MNLYKIETKDGGQMVVEETRSKASWLVLKEFQLVSNFGLDDPGYITSRRLLLRNVEGPPRLLDDRDKALVEAGAALIGERVYFPAAGESDYSWVLYEPATRQCASCGARDNLIYAGDWDGWQCDDSEACDKR